MSQASKPVFRTRNNAKVIEYVKELEIDMVSGSDTVVVEDAIPAGAYDVHVAGRVVTTIVMGGGGATFKVGTAGAIDDDDAFGSGLAKAAGTTFSPEAETAGGMTYDADTDIEFVANAGTWTSGTVRLVIAYRKFTAPTQ